MSQTRRPKLSVGDRVRVTRTWGEFFDGRNGTLEERSTWGFWMVRLDGAKAAVRIAENALQRLPVTEFPDS